MHEVVKCWSYLTYYTFEIRKVGLTLVIISSNSIAMVVIIVTTFKSWGLRTRINISNRATMLLLLLLVDRNTVFPFFTPEEALLKLPYRCSGVGAQCHEERKNCIVVLWVWRFAFTDKSIRDSSAPWMLEAFHIEKRKREEETNGGERGGREVSWPSPSSF